MQFSVLLSIYFKEKPAFLELALSSLVHQTRLPDEILLIEDGPLNDALYRVIGHFQQQYPKIFRIIKLPENKGLGNALRIGVEACTYDIIARMDSDDICLPERFEKQIAFLESRPDIAVVGANIEQFDEVPGDIKIFRIMPVEGEALRAYARFRSPVNHPSIVFRKAAVLDSGNYDGSILLWEDFSLFIRMLKKGYKFYNIQEVLLYFRVGSGIDSIKRRSGWKYMKSELKFAAFAKEIGHLSFFEWLSYITMKLPVRLLPPRLVLLMYNKLLRKSGK